MATTTTVQLGSYAPLTDSFTLGLDINDRATYFVDEIKTPQPKKQTVEVWNIRTVGTRYVKQQHQQREITVTLYVQAATVPALLTALQNLQSQVEGMSVGVNPTYATTPAVLKLQAPNATVAKYSLVLKTEHTIDYAVKELISNPAKLGGKKRISLIFSCWPFSFAIPRQWLANGVSNPGYEAPSGPGVNVFFDSFASTNAYSVQAGSAPTLASNVMTIPSGTRVAFGSPAWGAIQTWQVRFQAATGMTAQFYPHFTNSSNFCDIIIQLASWSLNQEVAGTNHQLATASITLTNGTFYWLQFVQFPSVSGNPPQVQATLFNDSSGSIGSQITNGTLGPVATFDAVTALVGQPQIAASGASLAIGGNFSGVHLLNLFGPGGWSFVGTNGSGICSGAWDGSRSEYGMSGNGGANTYPNGPVTSFGAARIDCPLAGTVNAFWATWGGGTPAGTSAIPVQTAGNVVQASAWIRQSGLSGTAAVALQLTQWDINGNVLGSTVTLQSKTAAQMGAGWTQFTGSQTTVASTAYVSVAVNVVDTSAGASAGATLWLDNVQMWDQTRTGMATMPYCELRFPQSPAQLLVSGLLGDAPAQAVLACGLYVSGTPASSNATLLIGRRKYASTGARLVYPANNAPMNVNGGFASVMPSTLDSSDPSGYYVGPVNSGMSVTHVNGLTPQDGQGVYRYFLRGYTANGSPGTAVSVYNARQDYQPSTGDVLGTYTGAITNPARAGAGWYWVDAGQVILPVFSRPSQGDPTAVASIVGTPAWADSGHNSLRIGTGFLLPADADTVVIGIFSMLIFVRQWCYIYADSQNATITYSIENAPIPHVSYAGGGGGQGNNDTAVNITTTADVGVWLDPISGSGYATGAASGVNQFAILAYDNNTNTFPVAVEFMYSPSFLYPL